MAKRKTILVVEDTDDYNDLARFQFVRFFPAKEYDLVVATNFMQAARALCEPGREIAGVLLDNGFPLEEGGKRKGKAREVVHESHKDITAHINEGSAGCMLVRFMRTGDPRAQTDESKDALEDIDPKKWLASEYKKRMEALKSVPIVWNSAQPSVAKIHEISAAARGELIDPLMDIYSNETIQIRDTQAVQVGENIWCTIKNARANVDFLSARLGAPTAAARVGHTIMDLNHRVLSAG